MATYVNDLRLKEIATGDESGTWGTSTNTNLELIAEAFSYGTEASFSSDADATTTIADGSTDPVRSLYLKVTSGASLTATRTLTIAPNTVSKVWIIENATSGSQSINISQGSGANVTIPNGEVKVVYSDGAGSGAAVVNAFTDLNLEGTTKAEIIETDDNIRISEDKFVYSYKGGTSGQVRAGFGLDGTNQEIEFYTATNQRGVVSDAGNFGFGNTNPDAFSSHVAESTGTILSLNASSGAGALGFLEGGSGRFYLKTLNGADGLAFVDADNSTERARFTATGQFDLSPGTGVTAINLKDGGTGGTNYGFIGGGNALKSGGSANDFSFRSDTGHIDFYTGGQNLRFRVNSGGAVEVKSDSLLVNSAAKADSEVTTFYGGTNNTKAVSMFNNRGTGSYNVMHTFYVGTTPSLVGRIDWDNTGSAMGFTNISDGRFKEVTGEAKGLELINKLNPVKYYFKDNDWESEGLIAQEVEKVFEELDVPVKGVRKPDEDNEQYMLDYSVFTTNLIKAVKELSAKVDELERKVN